MQCLFILLLWQEMNFSVVAFKKDKSAITVWVVKYFIWIPQTNLLFSFRKRLVLRDKVIWLIPIILFAFCNIYHISSYHPWQLKRRGWRGANVFFRLFISLLVADSSTRGSLTRGVSLTLWCDVHLMGCHWHLIFERYVCVCMSLWFDASSACIIYSIIYVYAVC